ncbi:sensor domain-containing diguanylate cyclase [Thalassolituus sp. LLYu03]|uniref:sensor domain-containing diguanylate cyclase n=1 Tax=Thalassolituus sp. LLYu03 TaxID=3421656 RepID=UPI003D2E5A6B
MNNLPGWGSAMTNRYVPDEEAHRLQALRALKILDTLPEDRFDRVTRVAASLFNKPIALMTLVDDNRVWFKSRAGFAECSCRRNISFCTHAILEKGVMLVEDARLDPRFADNPLVTGYPNIRFYAGYPLLSGQGHAVGTLCVLDQKPAAFSAHEADLLADLGRMVEDEMNSYCNAAQDALTGLYNRPGFQLLAQHSLSLCKRQYWSAMLLYMDLDGFNPLNERAGHAVGDQALQEFAQLLSEQFRGEDLIARLGNDEFVILMPNCPAVEYPLFLSRLAQGMAMLNRRHPDWQLGVSCGMAEIRPNAHQPLDHYIKQADLCMYESKRQNSDLPHVRYLAS